MRTLLACTGYQRLFAAPTISRRSGTVNTVALVVLVFRLTGSGLGVSGAVIAEILPVLLLAPVAGAAVDRLPRVRVMVAADLWRAALAGVLPLGDRHLAVVYVIAFGLSAGGVFFNPASAAVLPAIVGKDELVPPTADCGRPRLSPRSRSPRSAGAGHRLGRRPRVLA